MTTRKHKRKYPRKSPCQMGRQIRRLIGKGPDHVKRRRKLARALRVTPGYLQFLEVGETRTDGTLMRPSQALRDRFQRWRDRHNRAA